MLAGALLGIPALAADMSREQALADLEQSGVSTRLAAIDRLSRIGTMEDADQLIAQLGVSDASVRDAAEAAIWQIWSRSGDPEIDEQFERGLAQLRAHELVDALATFDDVVRRKPEFAEGWNKRATIYFLLGQNEKSLEDCDEVLKRNRHHFGALSGAGQIELLLGRLRPSLDHFRRAVELNPNLQWPARMIPIVEQRLSEQERNTI
ncbi:MAG: tetratricopeptide repeat protein [Rhizobacter sp.]